MRLQLIFYIIFLSILELPVIAQLNFTWDVDEGCAPLNVRMAIDTSSVDLSLIDNAEWDFGNGQILNAGANDTVDALFAEAQTAYAIKLTVTGTINESVSKFYNGVHEPLISNFSIEKNRDDPDYTYTFTPLIETLKSDANYTFAWEHIQVSDGSILKNKVHLNVTNIDEVIDQYTYANTGQYQIGLRVTEVNPTYNCVSTTDTVLNIVTEFIVGNVFAPESNDYFIVDPENSNVTLSFILFSRTGLKVFEQEAPIIYWDGRNSSGQDLGTAVYFYVIKATKGDITGLYSKTGFIHLFR